MFTPDGPDVSEAVPYSPCEWDESASTEGAPPPPGDYAVVDASPAERARYRGVRMVPTVLAQETDYGDSLGVL